MLKLYSYNLPIFVVTCKRDGEELIIREHCYEKVLVPNITKLFDLDELVTYLANGNIRFAPLYKLDELNTNNLEDTSISKFQVINSKNISTLKTENIPIKFIDSMLYYIIYEMRDSIERRYLKELEEEKMFMHKYDDTIKTIKAYNKKVDVIVQDVNDEGVKLQEEVQASKQLRMH